MKNSTKKTKFNIGDTIRNKNPYKGEPEKMVVDIDDYGYYLINVESEPTMKGKQHLFFDNEDSFIKID